MRNTALDLPLPDPDAQAHSQQLLELIADEIDEAGGKIPFDRFMELALYAPGLGYYTAGARKFGEEGDFVTAPEMSPLFAECVARQAAQVFEQLIEPHIVEFGAGSGRLAVDMLKALEKLDALPVKYLIMEVSADLKQRQKSLVQQEIPHLAERVEWLDALPADKIQAVVVANEVLDAMPVHRFRRHNGVWQEQFVAMSEVGLSSVWDDVASHGLQKSIDDLKLADVDIESEINMRQKSWLNGISQMLDAGFVILVDYGYTSSDYYHETRTKGTLMCHYRHRAHDNPLLYVGLQDITAHVDFSSVSHDAVKADLEVAGYSSQAFFLLGSGIEQIMMESDPSDVDAHMALVQSVRRLTLPTEMGERFQVLGLAKHVTSTGLIGFQMRDQRERL